MDLYRDLMRGTGFFRSLVEEKLSSQLGAVSLDESVATAPALWQLPIVDFMAIEDVSYLNALLDQVLPEDRDRFRNYLANRPLGLALITSVSSNTCSRIKQMTDIQQPASFGKTTYCAVATLALAASQGLTYGTAPTHIAISNMAERVERVDVEACRSAIAYAAQSPELCDETEADNAPELPPPFPWARSAVGAS